MGGSLVASAIAVGFLVGWFGGDHSLREWLLAYAGSLEFFGILLVAAPELVPLLQAAADVLAQGWRRTRAAAKRIVASVRRRFGTPTHSSIAVGGGDAITVADRASVRVSVKADATLEEKVEFLLRRDQGVQGKLEAHAERIRELPGAWKADIESVSSALRSEYLESLQRTLDRHLPIRLLGIAMLVLGIALATWGNLA